MSAAALFRPWCRVVALRAAWALWWLGAAICAWIESREEGGHEE